MISPKELLEKTEKAFFKIAAAELKGETTFPWVIPSNKKVNGSNFSDWRNDLLPLYKQSKQEQKKGYSVDWKEKIIAGSKQSVPDRIYFEMLTDYLFFTGKTKDFRNIVAARDKITNAFPALKDWCDSHPAILLSYCNIWDDLLKVCRYFQTNPPPHPYYLRELPIEVHSKFIEDNTGILKRLLDILLPTEWIESSQADFIGRYGVKKVTVHAQIRVLDDDLKQFLGYDECSIPVDDAAWLNWLPEKVFIIENQACYLSFPKVKNAVAIWGEGFKSRISKHIPWLEKTRLICWFDLDGAGFEMLNMIREYYPNAESFLMDKQTYNNFDRFAVNTKYRKRELPHLHKDERELYESLSLTEDKQRLEQERISQQYVQAQLSTLTS